MNHRAALVVTLLTLAGPLARPGAAQPPAAAEVPKTALELFNQARAEIRDGRFDVAAETLKKFQAANPSDRDFLDITAKEPTAFLKLRNVGEWSQNPTAQAESKAAIEAIIARAEEANKKLYQDPARIAKFVRNLGESLEERLYAEQQLKLGGETVGPVLIDTLRTSSDINLRAGIYAAIGKLHAEQLPPVVAAMEGVETDLKLGLLRALVTRPDATSLLASGDTDFTPHLWYYASAPNEEAGSLRAFATGVLERLTGGLSAKKNATAELVKLTQPNAAKQARFRGGERLKLWTWDAAKQTVTATDATRLQASDYLGLRNLRWALERTPNDPATQELFLTMTVERAVEKSQFGDLATADSALYQVLAAAPSDMLIGLLDRAMLDKQTARVLGFTQVLAARSDRSAATPGATGKAPVLVKALDYPDARVQLAAAVGLLRTAAIGHGKNARIVEILRRAAAVESTPAGVKETGRALIADPNDARADKLASHLRGLGYAVERFATGRDLSDRLLGAADIDMVFLDRHVVNPELRDLLPSLVKTGVVSNRPIFLVASTDAPKKIPFESLLLRLAVYVAVTETAPVEVPVPFYFDARKPTPDADRARADLGATRDRRLGELHGLRLARLQRLVGSSGLPQSVALQARLDQRLPQLTYAALAAEYPVTPESSPGTYKAFDAKTRNILANPQLAVVTDRLPTEGVLKLLEELETVLDAPRRQFADQMLARLDPAVLGLPVDSSRDSAVEDQLGRLARAVGGGRVVGEAYTTAALAEEIRDATGDPARLPTNPAEKKRSAKLAVEYLRRMALGEIDGYDIRPAEASLRAALKDDDLADPAIDAVARIPSAEAQQDLLALALTGNRPLPIRVHAAERVVQHVQKHGKLSASNLTEALAAGIAAEKDAELRTKLAVVRQLLVGKPGDLGKLLLQFPLPLPAPPTPPAAAPVPNEADPAPAKKPDGEK